jgi:sulfate/thiosulfate transport system substrate-binding protein
MSVILARAKGCSTGIDERGRGETTSLRAPRSGDSAVTRRSVLGLACVLLASPACTNRPVGELLHVSYDATRALYEAINRAFSASLEGPTAESLSVRQSHGGSGKQARSVLEGLDADVLSLALGWDLDTLADAGLVAPTWRDRLPDASTPYTSTVVLLVRAGNPKGVRDFDDLGRDDLSVLTPNPKTSGGARYNHLAVWGSAFLRTGSRSEADELVHRMYQRVPILEAGARAALTSFAERRIGDVLLAWESEAHLALASLGEGKLEIVVPTRSILAETPVSVVDRVVDRRGTRPLAERYLEFLWSDEAQALAAQHHLRPRRAPSRMPELECFSVESVWGGWKTAHAEHFADGASFDRAMETRR